MEPSILRQQVRFWTLIIIMNAQARVLLLLVTLCVCQIDSRSTLCNLKACSICSGYNLDMATCCQFEAMHSLCEECLTKTDNPMELQVCLDEEFPLVTKRRGLLGKRFAEKRRGLIGK
ncbi:hypothetical protein EG68_00857 [Paragonimus skrjabini miyazakii]|uniref:Uncharacterized protein n=1 Tax=Paragonimus skrjabini miyazakii TaxID=59628 RepID=A0A8S9Z5K3_9TREM|nr:hypothetical protein EG68_00857 [Paragonimus skrjabini miyazakii]